MEKVDSYMATTIWKEIGNLDNPVVLQWIPGHVGVEGNEAADKHAGVGCYDEAPLDIQITLSDAVLLVRKSAMESWLGSIEPKSVNKGNHHWKIMDKVSNKPWFKYLPLNGTEIKVLTRLRTGHGLCGIKKFQFKISNTYFRMECEEEDNLEHIVLYCDKHKVIRDNFKFHLSGSDLIDILKKSDLRALKDIVKFYMSAKLDL